MYQLGVKCKVRDISEETFCGSTVFWRVYEKNAQWVKNKQCVILALGKSWSYSQTSS